MGVSKYYWMAVEPDEYELPIAVADTARELAEHFGLTVDTIETSVFRNVSGVAKGRKFIKVRRESDGTDDIV